MVSYHIGLFKWCHYVITCDILTVSLGCTHVELHVITLIWTLIMKKDKPYIVVV